MLTHSNTHRTSLLIAAFLLLNAGSAQSQEKVIDLILGPIPAAGSDTIRTLESLTRVRGEGGLCQDALYLMSHYGDRMELFKQENQKAMDNPMINDTWRYCSIFANGGGDSVIVGRNWDNQNVGSIIISYWVSLLILIWKTSSPQNLAASSC